MFLFPAAPQNSRVTVAAFSNDSAAAEGARNRVRQRIVENAYFQPTKSPWAVLLCKFSDDLTEPFVRSFYEDLFTTSGVGTHNMVDFFRDVSHRRIDVSGTRVFGWYTLPKKRADYKGSGPNPAGRDELVNWARQAASDAGVDLTPYVGVVVCMNVQTDLFGGGGRVVCDNLSMEPSVLGQEMGHGYGLAHSRADGSTVDYMDHWDVMSTRDSVYMAADPRYTLIGPILNAANMAGRGWLDEARVWNAPPTGVDGTVVLRPLVRYDLPGPLAARVGNYLVEFRVKESWDAAIPEPAVLVHRFEDNRSYIMSAIGGRQDLVRGSVFQVGDPGVPFLPWTRVEVLGLDPGGYTATLKIAERPAIRIPVPRVGIGTILGGVAEDGGGLIIVGEKVVPIPPRSPALEILTQLATLHASDLIPDPAARGTLQREALAAVRGHIDNQLAQGNPYSSPAPHSRTVEGKAYMQPNIKEEVGSTQRPQPEKGQAYMETNCSTEKEGE